ncbi:hypothetical protein AMTR_s00003p00116780 [Amborella trichopoda]|uniref:Uncharacterized protein n=1 Tax=Amborella trichopoda TaxID=13333 RepID=W1P691_AMBTC|nr:hypothetical protein AMTR_s00003p00116780 [Amborella trichopoda]
MVVVHFKMDVPPGMWRSLVATFKHFQSIFNSGSDPSEKSLGLTYGSAPPLFKSTSTRVWSPNFRRALPDHAITDFATPQSIYLPVADEDYII